MSLLQSEMADQKLVHSIGGNSGSTAPVLARDADATYWMSRYVERAEHVARLLLISSEGLIDVGDLDDALIDKHWQSILQIMHIDAPVPGEGPLAPRIAEFMTLDTTNPSSLINCLNRARENARGIRELISAEMWEQLNVLYWSMRSDAKNLFREAPDQLYRQIMTGSMLFHGLSYHTLDHGQRWQFIQLGKYFERITVTCRILKAKYEILRDAEDAMEASLMNIHWASVLRSCCSIEGYRRTYLAEMNPENVAQFLILQGDFPRSVRFGVSQALQAISAIRSAVSPRAVDATERILGRLDAQLEYAEGSDLMAHGLPNYLEKILEAIAESALSVHRSFFLH